jgi:hypothetical protein
MAAVAKKNVITTSNIQPSMRKGRRGSFIFCGERQCGPAGYSRAGLRFKIKLTGCIRLGLTTCSSLPTSTKDSQTMINHEAKDWRKLHDDASAMAKNIPNRSWSEPLMRIAQAAMELEELTKRCVNDATQDTEGEEWKGDQPI